MKKTFLFACFGIFPFAGFSQVLISDAEPSSPPHASAVLELRSLDDDKGLILPKVALAATDNPSPLSMHVAGMTVYNTQVSGPIATRVEPGFYYNDGSSWRRIATNAPTIGDVKSSAVSADHEGWYLLNGRALNTLPAAALAYANALGFSANLPDATDRFLKTRTGTEVIGSIGGSSGISIAQANFPSFTFAATVSSAGLHNHSYNDRASGTGQSSEGSASQTVVDNSSGSGTTSSAGSHTHTFTVNTGGSGIPIPYKPPYLAANMFVYLGTN